MVYSFARVGGGLVMQVADYYVEGRKAWFRLYEKGCASGEPLLAAHARIDAWPKGGEPWPASCSPVAAESRTGGSS